MDFSKWNCVLIEWINCLKLLKTDVRSVTQLKSGEFFSVLLSELKIADPTYLYGSTWDVQLINFLKKFYPSYCLTNEPVLLEDDEEITYICSLLLHYCCIIESSPGFLEPLCEKLDLITQLYIKAFLEDFQFINLINKDVLKELIFNIQKTNPTPRKPNAPLQELFKTPIKRYQTNIETYSKEIKSLRQQLEYERCEKADLQEELQQQYQKSQKLEKNLTAKNTEISRLHAEIASLENKTPPRYHSSENRMEIKRLRDEIVSLEKYTQILHKEQEDLQIERDKTRSKFQKMEKQSKDWQEKALYAENIAADLTSEKQHLLDELTSLRERCEYLAAMLSDFKPVKSNDESYEADNSHIEPSQNISGIIDLESLARTVVDVQLVDAQDENKELKIQIVEFETNITILTKEISNLQTELDKFLQTNQYLKKCNEDLHVKVLNTEKKFMDSEENFKLCTLKLEDSVQENKKLNLNIKNLNEILQQAEQGNNELNNELKIFEEENKNLTDILNERTLENCNLLKQLNNVEQNLAKYKLEMGTLETIFNTFQNDLASCVTKMEVELEFSNENATTEDCNTRLEILLQNLKKKISNDSIKIADFSEKLLVAQNELSAVHRHLLETETKVHHFENVVVVEYDKKIEKYETHVKELTKLENERLSCIKELTENKMELTVQIKSLQERYNNLEHESLKKHTDLFNQIEVLQSENITKQITMELYKNEKEALQKQLNDLQNVKIDLQEQYQDSVEKYRELFHQFEEIQNENVTNKIKSQSLENEKSLLQKQFIDLEKLKVALQAQYQESVEKYTELVKQFEKIQIESATNKIEMDLLANEKSLLQNQYSDLEKSNNDLQEQYQQSVEKCNKLFLQFGQIQNENEASKIKIDSIENEKIVLQKQVSNLEKLQIELQEHYNDLVQESMEKYTELFQQSEKLRTENSKCKIEKEFFENESKLFQERLEKKTKEHDTDLKAYNEIQKQLQENRVELELIQNQLKEIKKKCKSTLEMQEIMKLEYETEINRLNEKFTESVLSLNDLKNTHQQIVLELENKIKQMTTEKDTIEKQLSELEKGKIYVQKQYQESVEKYTELFNQFKEIQKENATNKIKTESLENEKTLLQKQFSDLETLKIYLQEQCNNLVQESEEKFTELLRQSEELRTENSKYKTEMESFKNENKISQECLEKEIKQHAIDLKAYDETQKQLQQKMMELELVQIQLTDAKEKCASTLELQEVTKLQYETDIKKLNEKINESLVSFDERNHTQQEILADLENKIKQLTTEKHTLQKQLNDLKNVKIGLQEQYQESMEKYTELFHQCEELEKENATNKIKIEFLENEKTVLQKQFNDLEMLKLELQEQHSNVVHESGEKYKELFYQSEKLRTENSECKISKEFFEHENNILQERLEKLTKIHDTDLKTFEETQKQLQQKKVELESVQTQLQEVKEKYISSLEQQEVTKLQYETEINKLNEKISESLASFNKDNHTHQQILIELENKVKQLTTEKEQLAFNILSLEEERTSLILKLNDNDVKLEEINLECKSKIREAEETNVCLQHLRTSVRTLTNILRTGKEEEIESDISVFCDLNTEEEIKTFHHQVITLLQIKNNLHSELQITKNALVELELKYKELKNNNLASIENYESILKAKDTNIELKLNALNTELSKTIEKNDNLKTEKSNLISNMKNVLKELLVLKQTRNQTKEIFENITLETNRLISDLKKDFCMRLKLLHEENEIFKFQTKYNNMSEYENLKTKFIIAESQLSELKSKNKIYEQLLADKELDKEILLKENNNLQERFKILTAKYTEDGIIRNQELLKLQAAYSDIMAENSRLQYDCTALKKTVVQTKETYESLLEGNNKVVTELDTLRYKRIRDKEDFQKLLEEEQNKRSGNIDGKIKELRVEYEEKLKRMKEKMVKLYTEEVEKERQKVSTIRQEHKQAEETIASLKSQLWMTGNKYIDEKRKNEQLLKNLKADQQCDTITKRQIVHYSQESVRSLQELGVTNVEEFRRSTLPRDRRNSTDFLEESIVNSHTRTVTSTAPVQGLRMEDEEGELFNNTYLADLKAGRCIEPGRRETMPINRLSELQYRNSLCLPHLKSSYPAETQFSSPGQFKDEELKMGNIDLDDSMSSSLLPGERPKTKKDRGQTLYKKPGPPTPSKNGGRLSLQGNGGHAREVLREHNDNTRSSDRVKVSTPNRLKAFFRGSSSISSQRSNDTENMSNTPKGKRRSIFRK